MPRSMVALLALLSCPASCGSGSPAAKPESFDEARAWRDLEAIVALGPRPPGSEALEKTREYIEKELRSAGLEPVREELEVKAPPGFKPVPPGGVFAMANVYADLPAKDPAAELVIVASHFDTKIGLDGFLGANDAGSGTAALLELARVLAAGGPRAVSYRFLFLDGEESLRWEWSGDDNTYGSRHHAAGLKKSGLDKRVRCFVLIDMVGDKDLQFLRETYSDRRLSELFADAARKAGLGKYMEGKRMEARDDHLSFMAIGIPSIDLIDFEFGPDNKWWHTREDTLDKCSAASLGITGRIVLAAMPEVEKTFRRR